MATVKGEGTVTRSEGGERKLTIHDIAKRAGVSVATVSRVINRQPGVGAETRARLERLFAETGFSASLSAQQLATGKSRLIGVVFPVEISQVVLHPVYPALLGAIGDAAAERGHAVLLATTSGHLAQTVDVLRRHSVDGVILPAAGPDDPMLPALAEIDTATVLIGHRSEEHQFRWVDSDHDVAAYGLTRHLIEQGRRRLVHLGGPADVSACVLRALGFGRAMEEAGTAIALSRTEFIAFDSIKAAARARAILADPADRPDAIVCGSDHIAAGVLRAAQELAIDVPAALAVTGFDDLDLASHTTPPLTSVRMPLRALGEAAVSLLLDYPNQSSPHSVLLPTETLYRGSTEPSAEHNRSGTDHEGRGGDRGSRRRQAPERASARPARQKPGK
jgi:LacI family transcriptional regulator